MIGTGFTVFLPVLTGKTGKALKGSTTANFIPRMMKFCIEALFLIMNKKLKFTIGVMFFPTAVTAGSKTAVFKHLPISTGKRYVVDI